MRQRSLPGYSWSRTLPNDAGFLAIVLAAAVAAGGLGAVTGVGIGSALVPLVAVRVELKVAIAIVAAPHLIGGLVRAIQLRCHLDRRLLVRFGIVRAIASFAGALVHTRAASTVVAYAFCRTADPRRDRRRARRRRARPPRQEGRVGERAVSGFFGGFAGEQGGCSVARSS